MTAPKESLLGLPPVSLVDRMTASGLLGRGGGQFPVGDKWRAVRREGGDPVVVANGAEGEPGSIKDRFVMTRRPDDVLLGLALAARAVGASRAYVCLKGSFTGAEAALHEALRARPLDDLVVLVQRGADTYVSGEETALLESLEGRRAWPRPKPPHPAAVGFEGRPTLVQNVETLARVPTALSDPPAFRAAPSTLVSVWGHVRRPGVHEVRLGTPLEAVLSECAGGAPDGVSFVFPAGPSATPLPAELLATPLEAGALRAAGSALGTASLLVIGAACDPLSVLASLAAFFEREACGQCPPCTVGTATLHRIVRAVGSSAGRVKDLQDFGEAAGFMKDHGYCAHARTAATSVGGLLQRAQAVIEARLEGQAASGRKARPFDPDSPELLAIEAVAAGFAAEARPSL